MVLDLLRDARFVRFVLGAVSVYALFRVALVLLFAIVYWLVSLRDPKAFSRRLSLGDALYLSVATGTTLGYWDVAPVGRVARTCTGLHALSCVF